MPGASKKRGKLDRQGPRGAGQGPRGGAPGPAQGAAPPVPAEAPAPEPAPADSAASADPAAFDGPGDNRGGPPPSRQGGRPPTTGPSGSARSGSQAGRGESSTRASSRPRVDPAREPSMILNKNVDFPGNAYNLISQVSSEAMMSVSSRI